MRMFSYRLVVYLCIEIYRLMSRRNIAGQQQQQKAPGPGQKLTLQGQDKQQKKKDDGCC